VCGLQAGGAALFCWPSTPAPQWGQLRRIYNGPAPLADLAVGADHVAAYDASGKVVLWWRSGGWFPARADGAFRSLVSGDGFSCAVQANASASVRCWGPQGSVVQAGLTNASAAPYLAAGGTRVCAVLASGTTLCSGSDASADALPAILGPRVRLPPAPLIFPPRITPRTSPSPSGHPARARHPARVFFFPPAMHAPRPRRRVSRPRPRRRVSRRCIFSWGPKILGEKMHLSDNEGIEGLRFMVTSGQGFVGISLYLKLLRRDAREVRSLDLRISSSWSRQLLDVSVRIIQGQ
jgi:hypothetical protein